MRPPPGRARRPGRHGPGTSASPARPLGPVRVVDVLDLGLQLRAVGQQLDHWRFVGDQRPHLPRVGGDQREPDDGSAAAAKDVRRLAAERGQQAVDVVGLLLGRHIFAGVLAAATGAGRDRLLQRFALPGRQCGAVQPITAGGYFSCVSPEQASLCRPLRPRVLGACGASPEALKCRDVGAARASPPPSRQMRTARFTRRYPPIAGRLETDADEPRGRGRRRLRRRSAGAWLGSASRPAA